MALVNNEMMVTIFLPLVSAKYPHKKDPETTPKKLIEYKSPFSPKVRLRSHCAAGVMNIALIVSTMTHIREPPVASRTNKLNLPIPKNKIYIIIV